MEHQHNEQGEQREHAANTRYETIVCIDDLLRGDFWPAREFIYDVVRLPIFSASGLNIGKGVRRGNKHNLLAGFDPERFVALCTPAGAGGIAGAAAPPWVQGYNGVPAAAAQYLQRHLPSNALVLSYEMPPWLERVLSAAGNDWVDVRMSPLRFASDLYVGLRTNNPQLYAAAHAVSASATEVAAEAALLAARLRYRLRYEGTAGALDQACVFIGQTEFDASLLADDGRFVRVAEHSETLRKLAASGPLQYKPHPLAGDFAVRERAELERITGAKVLLCEVDTYELLAREENVMLVGLSSGVLQEAAWFGREAYALFKPISQPRFDAGHSSAGMLQIASHVFMSQPLWSAVTGTTGAQPPLLLPPRANHLRELHNTWWGYGAAVLRHSSFEREAFASVGGTRIAEALRRCEADLTSTRNELATLKARVGATAGTASTAAPPQALRAPAAMAAASSPAASAAMAAPVQAAAVTDARIDTLRMEVDGLKEALRVVLRQNAHRAMQLNSAGSEAVGA